MSKRVNNKKGQKHNFRARNLHDHGYSRKRRKRLQSPYGAAAPVTDPLAGFGKAFKGLLSGDSRGPEQEKPKLTKQGRRVFNIANKVQKWLGRQKTT